MKNRNSKIRLFLIILSSLIISTNAIAACPEGSKETYKKVLKRAEKSGLPGVLYYYKNDSCEIKLSKGHSNLKIDTELKEMDRFVIGSITKTFISVTSVKLADLGVFSLDDNLEQWLPSEITDQIPKSNEITIRHLLSHSSGIFDYVNDSNDYFDTMISNPYIPRTELDAFSFAANKPLHFDPGTDVRYSNTGYLLMGLIINAATNKHYTRVVREMIIEPLALNNTFHLAESSDYQLEYVHGYSDENNVWFDTHDLIPNFAFADGGIVSNTQDLATFIKAVFTDKLFMNESLLATLLSTPVNGSPMFLGVFLADQALEKEYKFGHNGAWPGYLTSLHYIPANNETIVSFSNGNGSSKAMDLFNYTYTLELMRERIQSQRAKVILLP